MHAFYEVWEEEICGSSCPCCNNDYKRRTFHDLGDGKGAAKAFLSARRLAQRRGDDFRAVVYRFSPDLVTGGLEKSEVFSLRGQEKDELDAIRDRMWDAVDRKHRDAAQASL